jgi:hypothetical protein
MKYREEVLQGESARPGRAECQFFTTTLQHFHETFMTA